jgi:hypothetical protein
MSESPYSEILTVEDPAKWLKVSKRSIYEMTDRGQQRHESPLPVPATESTNDEETSSAPPAPVVEAIIVTRNTPQEIVAATLEDPAIKEAIHRGVLKAHVKKHAAVLYMDAIDAKGGRDEVRDYISDFVQATYLALLEEYAEEYAALTPEQRSGYVERIAKRIGWREVYPMKREVPLAEPLDADQDGSEGDSLQLLACDDISLGRQNRHPNWITAHALESELVEQIDGQRAETQPEKQPETRYERICKLLGPQDADFMLDYEHRRYESARTGAERVRYHRLKKKLEGM